jgi:hypothetical protein
MRANDSPRRLRLLALALAGHLLVGCCLAAPGGGGDQGGGKAADELAPAEGAAPAGKAAPPAAPAARPAPARRLAPGEVPTEADLVAALGGKASGWVPVVFQGLRKGMTPAEVEGLFPGAAALDKHQFSRVPATVVPGGAEIRFQFLGRHGLRAVEVSFDKALAKAPGFWDRLAAVCSAKWDHVKPKDVDKEMKMITWGYDRTAQIAIVPAPGGGEVCHLNVQL